MFLYGRNGASAKKNAASTDECCIVILNRGSLDTMEPQIVTTDKEQARSAVKWGAQTNDQADLGQLKTSAWFENPTLRNRSLTQ